MRYYPVYLNLKGHTVLVVGAGPIALQKVNGLLVSEASVRVIAPEALPEIQTLDHDGKIEWLRRNYASHDMDNVSLVFAATDDKPLQERIASEARARGLWVNIVDVPPLCDFIVPAIVNQGDLQIAISTGGAAPALAKFLRQKLEAVIGPEYADFVRIVQQYRPDILKLSKPRRDSLWGCIVSQGFLDQIKTEGPVKAEANLKEWIYGNSSL